MLVKTGVLEDLYVLVGLLGWGLLGLERARLCVEALYSWVGICGHPFPTSKPHEQCGGRRAIASTFCRGTEKVACRCWSWWSFSALELARIRVELV